VETFIPEDSTEGLEELSSMWGWLLAMGILWLMYAWIVLSFKFSTVWAIVVFAGAAFVAGGIAEIALAMRLSSWRWLYIALGAISIVAGIACFVWPGQTFLVFAAILAWYLLFKGVLDLIQAFMTRRVDHLWWMTLIAGIAQVGLGFWAIGYEGRSIALLVVWVGAMALFRGIANIVLAFKVRSFGQGGGPRPAVA
jgi:uncharacterized membrane protein HdeD (DUF308 family)